MAPKKKTIKDKAKDKNVLYDPFLDRSIALAPSPYEVYRESESNPAKSKAAESAQSKASAGKPKLNLKQLDQSPSPALTASPTPELTGTDPSASQSTPQMPQTPAKSGGFWNAINSDIVWFSIALASILGVLLFYFQGLQPLILGNYVDQSQARLVELNKSYTDKVSNYANLRTSLINQVGYNPAGTCADEPLYTGLQSDTSQLDLLRVGLLPNTSLKDLPKYQIFYEKQIQNYYNEAYNSYADSLAQIRNTSSDIFSVPSFLDYRNVWITACQKISSSKGDLSVLKAVCSEVKAKTQNYQQTGLAGYADFRAKADAGANKCTEVESAKGSILSGYGQWYLDWLNKYSAIMSFKPFSTNPTQSINDLSQKFSADLKKSQQKINEVYNSRLGFWNIWYLMNF